MGPLHGVKVIEIKGIGPGPYATMLLSDMGAEVITVERSRQPAGIGVPAMMDMNCRGKSSIALNLKTPEGVDTLLTLIDQADMLVEGFRPGVAEKLGFGPEVCHARNAKLVYGRITGWGQTGPLAKVAGHDINYISLTGALAAIGTPEKPIPPLNIVGDYGGGSLFLVMGMLAALYKAQQTGEGDVVDAAITDGAASLMTMAHTLSAVRAWSPQRQTNMLDGAAHFYRCYQCKDDKWVSVGSIEPQFYALLVEKAGLNPETYKDQMNPMSWAQKSEELEGVFKQKTQAEWCEIMEGTDVCFAPVLDFIEAPNHPHNQARGTYISVNGHVQPAPAPKFTNSALATPEPPHPEGADTEQVLAQHGFSEAEIGALKKAGALPE